MAAPSGTPSSVFKHAIDLNRVSNSLQKPLAVAYNRILVKAARELQAMGTDEYSSSYRAKRLGQIIGSLKTSLDGWAKDSRDVSSTSPMSNQWCQPWPSCQTYTDPARSSSVMRSRSGMMQSRSSYRRGGRSRRRR